MCDDSLGSEVEKFYFYSIGNSNRITNYQELFNDYLEGSLRWQTKEGNGILVSEMSDNHIKNCLRIPAYRDKETWDIIFKIELYKVRKAK